MKKVKKKKDPYICVDKCCLQSFLANIKHLIKKKPYILCVLKREVVTLGWIKKGSSDLCESLIHHITINYCALKFSLSQCLAERQEHWCYLQFRKEKYHLEII